MERVPLAARVGPPDTGASRIRGPPFRPCWEEREEIFRQEDGEIVDIKRRAVVGGRVEM